MPAKVVAPASAQATLRPPWCALLAIRVFHIFIALYLLIWVALYLGLPASSIRSGNIYAPTVSGAIMASFVVLHLYGLCQCSGQSNKSVEIAVAPLASTGQMETRLAYATHVVSTYQDIIVVVFNLFEIACQSLRVLLLADNITQPFYLVTYTSLIVLYAMLSPLFLFVRNTSTKDKLVNALDFVFTFSLSVGLPFLSVGVEWLVFAVKKDPTYTQDNGWYTRILALGRLLVISSPLDLVCQASMQLGTYISLKRLEHSFRRRHLPRVTASSTRHTLGYIRSHQAIRMALTANVVLNLGWACFLAGLLVRAVAFRTPCPPQCALAASPIFDLGCNCLYVELNCATLQTQDVPPLIDTSVVGSRVLFLQIARCDLPQGLNTSTLAPHTQLYKLAILFSNMTHWDAALPPSIGILFVRFSLLQTLPGVITANVPPYLFVIYLDSSPIGTIDATAFARWSRLERLFLTNVSLSSFPDAIMTLPLIDDVNLRDNNLTNVPMTWQAQTTTRASFRSTRFNGNHNLQVGPWAMARTGVILDLSSTAIASVDASVDVVAAIAKGQIVLDETPFCKSSDRSGTCKAMLCAAGCYAYMQGDHYCDPVCFNQACAFDGGDCDTMGFIRD
ncbi:Aste57867_20737 [Aphanomyces stellatus]|uniref:Aste57867_20737 protein n=1 Tax=Aphanomyces stellatus TaxID=120398 RepID=A0A485LGA7_9STRA|nr:hypothetical protein As57867_020669 [Aphanomyces stellatus]VFT97417.1 Aste57867_20737 [Aphanomyces stellatus]